MDIFGWTLAIFALVGTVLNIRQKVSCFYIWTLTNAGWVFIDFKADLYHQAALQAIYFGLAIWGIFAWKNRGKDEAK